MIISVQDNLHIHSVHDRSSVLIIMKFTVYNSNIYFTFSLTILKVSSVSGISLLDYDN